MSAKVLALGSVVLIAVIGFGFAAYFSKKRGGDGGFMLKMMGLVISMSLAAFAWGKYSDTVDDMSKEAQEKKEKDAIVVSVKPAGVVQGGMQTTDSGFIFSIVQKGLNAEIQLRGTGREYLCVGGSGNCMRLSSN